jgi:ketosteroid isomerase-like protein
VERDDAIDEAVDRAGVDRLQRAYADAITRRDWAAVHDLFLPDAVVSLDLVTRPLIELHGPGELVAFVSGAMERFAFFQFVILNSHVDLWSDGDRTAAEARVFICELRQDEGATTRNETFGLYRDTYRKLDDGPWRIAARAYRSIARYPAGEVFPLA